ncbi:cell division inhibitor SepF [Haloechinothrix alba]|uniref:Cell division protein SepF n=1 Tax=Haloechinothrix alba TaxID=664784 RepID=A0A238VMU0_9PSEU|nr:cell division protein SepF [Haloechinothrix alba]SNR35680.1 cell division inhibitor SepF [Haloechinothrix alba]
MSTLQRLKAYFGMIPADDEGYDDYPAHQGYRYDYREDYRDEEGYMAEEPPHRGRGGYRMRADPLDEPNVPVRGRGRGSGGEPAVAGALAMDRQPEQVTRLRSVPEYSAQPAAPPARDPLSRIVTLHPSGYSEAREIGEHFRDGSPVIMNLTEMENADAKRLVDFAAGLAFALQGSIDKVTNKVFLLSPPDIDVSAEDRRRIAEGGLFLRR